MALKTLQADDAEPAPAGAGRRSELYKGKPVKGLVEGKPRPAAATTTAAITVRWRGGGHKRAYRIVDFKRRKLDMPATVERLEYDPNRTRSSRSSSTGRRARYILAPQRLASATPSSPASRPT
jgi:large subunit ribosomal protein L2